MLKFNKIDQDMNIDCLTEEIKINSHYIHKIKDFNLGTEKFFNSVHTVGIRYNKYCKLLHDTDINIDVDIGLIHRYFKNLKKINMINTHFFSQTEIVRILKSHKIKHLSSETTYKGVYDYKITSKAGCVAFYDCKNMHYFDCKNIEFLSYSKNSL